MYNFLNNSILVSQITATSVVVRKDRISEVSQHPSHHPPAAASTVDDRMFAVPTKTARLRLHPPSDELFLAGIRNASATPASAAAAGISGETFVAFRHRNYTTITADQSTWVAAAAAAGVAAAAAAAEASKASASTELPTDDTFSSRLFRANIFVTRQIESDLTDQTFDQTRIRGTGLVATLAAGNPSTTQSTSVTDVAVFDPQSTRGEFNAKHIAVEEDSRQGDVHSSMEITSNPLQPGDVHSSNNDSTNNPLSAVRSHPRTDPGTDIVYISLTLDGGNRSAARIYQAFGLYGIV